jgi:hypothetical protein
MEVDDFFEAEVAVAVAATAALFSPKVRRFLRRGAVYGVAGALKAGDALTGMARGVGRGILEATAKSHNGSDHPQAEPAHPMPAQPRPRSKAAAQQNEPAPAEQPIP